MSAVVHCQAAMWPHFSGDTSMLGKISGAALLALLCSAAQADTGWITIKGFYDDLPGRDVPDGILHGRFDYTDSNGDGIVVSSEVDYLEISGQYFGNGCSEPWYCSLDLTYSLSNGKLDIYAYNYSGDWEHIVYSTQSFSTSYGYSQTRVSGSWSQSRDFIWRDYTTISVSAVPEPTTVSMLLAGLVGTFAMRRRNKA